VEGRNPWHCASETAPSRTLAAEPWRVHTAGRLVARMAVEAWSAMEMLAAESWRVHTAGRLLAWMTVEAWSALEPASTRMTAAKLSLHTAGQLSRLQRLEAAGPLSRLQRAEAAQWLVAWLAVEAAKGGPPCHCVWTALAKVVAAEEGGHPHWSLSQEVHIWFSAR